jgi:amidophosphoribosyltransferase
VDADTVAYLSLDGLTGAVKGGSSKYCTSCYTGVYPVAFPRDEAAYLQLALKLNADPALSDREVIPLMQMEKDSVAS